MKKVLTAIIIILMLVSLLGCSQQDSGQKSEEELRAEISAELEAEAKAREELEAEVRAELEAEQEEKEEVKKLSYEELNSKKEEYESKLFELLGGVHEGQIGGYYTDDITQFHHYENNSEFKEYVDMLIALGYGIEQAEGFYYLYVGEPKNYLDGEGEDVKQQAKPDDVKSSTSDNVLIESDGEQGYTTYYKYKSNETVHFDLNGDGKKEEIIYQTDYDEFIPGKLIVSGFDPIEIHDFPFGETDYFIIVKFSDKFGTSMNMIGIIDYGPSMDPTTSLYAIIEPRGEEWFGSVGVIEGELVPPSEYNENSMDDFNYKAVLRYGQGIEAPVRLSYSVAPQTWFGRNLFTYYGTYASLIDNIAPYGNDYVTNSELKIEEQVTGYAEKNMAAANVSFKAGQSTRLVATDNDQWIKMVAADGTEGWVLVSDVTAEKFSGFVFFD